MYENMYNIWSSFSKILKVAMIWHKNWRILVHCSQDTIWSESLTKIALYNGNLLVQNHLFFNFCSILIFCKFFTKFEIFIFAPSSLVLESWLAFISFRWRLNNYCFLLFSLLLLFTFLKPDSWGAVSSFSWWLRIMIKNCKIIFWRKNIFCALRSFGSNL